MSAFKEQVGGNHYSKMAIQPAEYCFKNGIGKLEGDAIAYLSRWKDKNGLEDLKKARHTIDLLIELEVSKRNEAVNLQGNDLKANICDTMNLADAFLKDIRATELAYAENQHKTLWTEADEERAGIIALNGNEGDHYREAMSWKRMGDEMKETLKPYIEAGRKAREAQDGGWIEWSGRERPVPWRCGVDIRLACGEERKNVTAGCFNWDVLNSGEPIAAYRICNEIYNDDEEAQV